MTADLRRFEYPLEPVLQHRRAALEAQRAQLASIDRELRRREEEVATLREALGVQAARATALLARFPDPRSHATAVAWLARLQGTIRAADAAVAEARTRRSALVDELLALRCKVEAIERHREECVAEFVRAEQRRVAAEADRDWLARRAAGGLTQRGTA